MTREEVAIAQENFHKRKAENAKKPHMRNEDLPAGSPMYFYCRYCGEPTDTLPETYVCRPRTVCIPCENLEKLGAIPK